MLRVSEPTAVGASETGGQAAKHYPTAEALFDDLEAFRLGGDATSAAARQLSNPETRKRFMKFAEDVQIPFDALEQADIYLLIDCKKSEKSRGCFRSHLFAS